MAETTTADGLSPGDRRLLNAWLVTFENAWSESRLAKQVSDLPAENGPLRRAALTELIKLDLRRQWQNGKRVRVETYLSAFPELGTPETVDAEIILAEYRARNECGDSGVMEKLLRRFPNQAAKMRQRLQPVDGASRPSERRPASAPTARSSSLAPWLLLGGVVVAGLLLICVIGFVYLVRTWNQNAASFSQITNKVESPDTSSGTSEPPKADADVDNSDKLPPVDEKKAAVRLDQESVVDSMGNAQTKLTLKMAPERIEAFRQMMTRQVLGGKPREIPLQAKNLLDYMDLDAAGSILQDTHADLDNNSLRLQTREISFAKHKDGRWVYPLSADATARYDLVKKERSQVVTLRSLQEDGQVLNQTIITLPSGAYDIEVLGKPSRLVYRLGGTAGAAPAAPAKPSLTLETKPYIMSALYKLYGDTRFPRFWAARSALHNTSTETLTNYQVRFRIARYSNWGSWTQYDAVVPGQTIVDNYQPIIDAKVRELTNATPVDIEVEAEYTRPNGEKVHDSHTERTKLLGFNEGVYTDVVVTHDSPWRAQAKNAPWLLASFAAGNDPVMLDVVGMLSKTTQGAAAGITDRDAMVFLQALFDLMRCNISYETTPGSVIDGLVHQHLKYGRDVLRTKSGTCINTSIFFASVVEAAGMNAYLVVVPGHCYAAARLPESGKLLFVETTFCGGGTMATSGTFVKACAKGAAEFRDASKTGLFVLVNIADMRAKGVTPPELPDVGNNALEQWKIVPPEKAVAQNEPNDVPVVEPPAGAITSTIVSIRKEPDRVFEGHKGMVFHVRLKITGARNTNCVVFVMCLDENKEPVPAVLDKYSLGGYLAFLAAITPRENEEEFKDVVLFLPNDGSDLPKGENHFLALIAVGGPKGELVCDAPALVPYTITKRR
jgi:hypothetical protein